jgi:hypothetical protein
MLVRQKDFSLLSDANELRNFTENLQEAYRGTLIEDTSAIQTVFVDSSDGLMVNNIM